MNEAWGTKMETVGCSTQDAEEQKAASGSGVERPERLWEARLALWKGGGRTRGSGQRKQEGRRPQPSAGVGAACSRSRAERGRRRSGVHMPPLSSRVLPLPGEPLSLLTGPR